MVKIRNRVFSDVVNLVVRNYGDYPDMPDLIHAQIDKSDLSLVPHGLLHTIRGGYVAVAVDGQARLLHRCFLPNAIEVDHIDRDKLNNRRYNLRDTTRGANMQNMPGRGVSGYKGVFPVYRSDRGQRVLRYIVKLSVGGIQRQYGPIFSTAEDAARHYDMEALRVYGPSAYQNGV